MRSTSMRKSCERRRRSAHHTGGAVSARHILSMNCRSSEYLSRRHVDRRSASRDSEQLEAVPAEFTIRFDVRPGSQVLRRCAAAAALHGSEQLSADAEYVREHGFFYDLRLILLTVYVAYGKGIYGEEGQNWRAYRDELRAKQNRAEEG